MCKPVKCPQCGHEFTPERAIKSGAWTPEEDELLLNGYQKERKTIAELSDELNRSQDATRNRLFVLRGGGKPKRRYGKRAAHSERIRRNESGTPGSKERPKARRASKGHRARARRLYALGKQLINAKAKQASYRPSV